jgi:alcohol/geraniol dehydrogenase (NADP+)
VTKIHAYAAREPKGRLAPFDYDPTALGDHDVELAISHCGLCYSDIHLIDDDWKKSSYPLVPGHEVIGKVLSRGAAVHHLAIGQRVGVGWQRSACGSCELCLTGNENLCLTQTATATGQHGGFAHRMIADARFALPIPDQLDSAKAAPLLCGGVTVYAPMRRFGITARSRVGVIGIGGLGSMALTIANRLGAEVTAFTSTHAKRDEALRMGAHLAVPSNDIREVKRLAGRLDLLLSTVHVRLDYTTFLQVLRPNGTLVLLGGGTGLLTIPQPALLGQRVLTTGEIGTRAAIAELLDLAARHAIEPIVEVAPLSQVQAQVDRLRANEVRYRAVLAT